MSLSVPDHSQDYRDGHHRHRWFANVCDYVIEGAENGFTSIPKACTELSVDYEIIAVPTGIVTMELNKVKAKGTSTEVCHFCSREGHDEDAEYCKYCGGELNP